MSSSSSQPASRKRKVKSEPGRSGGATPAGSGGANGASSSAGGAAEVSPVVDGELKAEFLRIIESYPDGITDDDCIDRGINRALLAPVVNELILEQRLEVRQMATRTGQATLVYVLRDVSVAKKRRTELSALSRNDQLVLALIEGEANKGIWIRDLRRRSGLTNPQLTKILTTLEGRKLIKSVKSVAHKNKRVYMLYDLEPSLEVKGRMWYSNGEYDAQLHETLGKAFIRILEKDGGSMSVNEFKEILEEMRLVEGALPVEDIMMRVQALVYDGKLEVDDRRVGYQLLGLKSDDSVYDTRRYTLKKEGVDFDNSFLDHPCLMCPVRQKCHPNNPISPQKCSYYSQWMVKVDAALLDW